MKFVLLTRYITTIIVVISSSMAMEVEKTNPSFLRINPSEIDNTATITCNEGIGRGFHPYKIINLEQLQNRGTPEVLSLDLTSNVKKSDPNYIFPDIVIKTIFANFPNLTYLDLSNNQISALAMEILLVHLKTNQILTTVKLSNTGFCKIGSLYRLTIDQIFPEPMLSDPPMRELEEGDHFMLLMEGIQKVHLIPIAHLNESRNTDNYDVKYLCEVLTANATLKELDLSNNAIESKHISLLLGGLKTNGTLAILNLDGNQIDPSGIELIEFFGNFNTSPKISFKNQLKENGDENGECIIS